jgi:DNA-directed RNA polymerase specialized sigma24 family protein
MSDEVILERLLTKGNQPASDWEAFLRRFSNLILKVIWQFEKDYDQAMDKYLYVCRKLAENSFAILRRFQQKHGDNPPQFTTWLTAVTHNLCIDAHRVTHGRRQLPQAVLRLSEFDREVFRLYYWRGYSEEEIEQQLATTEKRNALTESLERIQGVIVGSSTGTRSEPTMIPFDERDAGLGSSESDSDFAEMLGWLQRWLDELSDQDRMIIRLKFWEDMSGAEIAAAMRISPEQRIYPLLHKAIARLRERAMRTYSVRKTGDLSV